MFGICLRKGRSLEEWLEQGKFEGEGISAKGGKKILCNKNHKDFCILWKKQDNEYYHDWQVKCKKMANYMSKLSVSYEMQRNG